MEVKRKESGATQKKRQKISDGKKRNETKKRATKHWSMSHCFESWFDCSTQNQR